MKVLAINGSPRKTKNTATLLNKALEGAASVGAQTELIHLYDLNFKGCISCFACKRKNTKFIARCAVKDDLTEVLEKVSQCDALILGSPIYFGNITGEMQSFLERLLFSNLSYNEGSRSVCPRTISSGFIYTMNVPKDFIEKVDYDVLFNRYKGSLQILNGESEYLVSADTYQFDDYSKYEATKFNEVHKAKIKAEQFPVDCENAFNLGVKLATS